MFNSLYVTTDIWHRIAMSVLICTVMFMAASITAIDGKGWTYFVLAFAANRALIAFLYYRAKRAGAESTSICGSYGRFACFGCSSSPVTQPP